MGLFSGDGAGVLGRLLSKFGAIITGGLHLKMPDSISDINLLKHPYEKDIAIIENSKEKIKNTVENIKLGKYSQEGLSFVSHILGLFGQRLWFQHEARKYKDKLKINKDRCIGCALCAKVCPTNNIIMKDNKAEGQNSCTMCYRCINKCPKQAITLLGKKVVRQATIEKYL